MIIPVLILSVIFVGISFIINEDNAKYLLSGYNTMSEDERQLFDIKSYLVFFKKFHLFLGVSFLIIALLLLFFVNPDWCGIFLGTYPILAYIFLVWKSNSFTKAKGTKQRNIAYFTMLVMFFLLMFIVFEFNNSMNDNQITVNKNELIISGSYGETINISDIQSVNLIDSLPKIASKKNGFALETIKKGYFTTANGEKVKLLINKKSSPLILIITKNNQKLYYSSKTKANKDIYSQLKTVVN